MAAWTRTRRAAPVDLLVLLGGVIFAAYFIKLAANFPKYHVGMLPFWAVALAWWLVDWWPALEGAAALSRRAARPSAATSWRRWATPGSGPRAGLGDLRAGARAGAVRGRGGGGGPAWRPAAPGGGVVALLLLSVGLAVPWTPQAGAAYSTSYYYGTHGQRQAAALDALGYDGAWIGAKEVAWYARNKRYIDADTFWWLVIAEGLHFDGMLLGTT